MTLSEAVWNVARQHVHLFAGFIILSAAFAICQALFGRQEVRWMALMTGVWVAINAGIAVWLSEHIRMPTVEQLPHVFTHVIAYMRLNVVADVVYALLGWLLHSYWGAHRTMLRGFGKAILIQAAGLFILDLVFLARVVVLNKQ